MKQTDEMIQEAVHRLHIYLFIYLLYGLYAR